MKRRLTGVCLLIAASVFCIGIHMCYAGTINGNEKEVISAASGVFEYDGVSYKAKPEYVAALRAKLSEDDMDLTAEQSQKAIAAIYANVGTGVVEGYLIPVNGSKKENNLKKSKGNSQNKSNSAKQQKTKINQDKKEKYEDSKSHILNDLGSETNKKGRRTNKDIQTKKKSQQIMFAGGIIIAIMAVIWFIRYYLIERLKSKECKK